MLRRLLAVFVALPLLAVSASAQTATTVCKDGTTTVTTGRGACTGHGGAGRASGHYDGDDDARVQHRSHRCDRAVQGWHVLACRESSRRVRAASGRGDLALIVA